MGIRIHKMIGYGLDDVKYDNEKCEMIDPRFSKTGYFGMDCYKQEDNFTDEGFDEYVSRAIAEDTSDLKLLQRGRSTTKKKKGHYSYEDSISDCVVYDPEFGLDNVVLFTPPGFNKNWKRYDDIIDYYEPSHHEADGGIGSGITLLKRTIWPFESYVDCRTMPPTRLNSLQWSLFVDSNQDNKYAEGCAEAFVKTMNFESVEEMRKMIRPIVPEELVVLLKYLNVFENEEDIHQLKPMLYWYWG